jgi:hypothetical protein
MRVVVVLFSFLFFVKAAVAQELNFDVSITTPKLNLVDPNVFKTLENSMTEFFNNTSFTDDEFEDDERIQGNIQLIIKDELSATSFLADLRIQSIRPVFGSNYSTQLMNYIEKDIAFSYRELQPIDKSVNGYVDNLSSILSYFAYTIIAFDYDSFSPQGGQTYFTIAQNIMDAVPSDVRESDAAWTVRGPRRSRYWIWENSQNAKFVDYRNAFYDYHRLSLDRMAESPDEAKDVMVKTIETMRQVERSEPNAMLVQMFVDSKREEILEIFKNATKAQQSAVYKAMVKIDPARISDYGLFK